MLKSVCLATIFVVGCGFGGYQQIEFAEQPELAIPVKIGTVLVETEYGTSPMRLVLETTAGPQMYKMHEPTQRIVKVGPVEGFVWPSATEAVMASERSNSALASIIGGLPLSPDASLVAISDLGIMVRAGLFVLEKGKLSLYSKRETMNSIFSFVANDEINHGAGMSITVEVDGLAPQVLTFPSSAGSTYPMVFAGIGGGKGCARRIVFEYPRGNREEFFSIPADFYVVNHDGIRVDTNSPGCR